jgi:DNA-binding XRE family transcriptional regulator
VILGEAESEKEVTKEISGRQIAAARALLGLSQRELARKVKISTPALIRMEAKFGEPVGLINKYCRRSRRPRRCWHRVHKWRRARHNIAKGPAVRSDRVNTGREADKRE